MGCLILKMCRNRRSMHLPATIKACMLAEAEKVGGYYKCHQVINERKLMPLSGYCTLYFNDTIFQPRLKSTFETNPSEWIAVQARGPEFISSAPMQRARKHCTSLEPQDWRVETGRLQEPSAQPKGESQVSERPYLKGRRQKASEEDSLNPPLDIGGHICPHACPYHTHTCTQKYFRTIRLLF